MQSIQGRPARRFEMTPAGAALTTDSSSKIAGPTSWPCGAMPLNEPRPPRTARSNARTTRTLVLPHAGVGPRPAERPLALDPGARGDGPPFPFRIECLDGNNLIPGLPMQPPGPPPVELRPQRVIPLLPRATTRRTETAPLSGGETSDARFQSTEINTIWATPHHGGSLRRGDGAAAMIVSSLRKVFRIRSLCACADLQVVLVAQQGTQQVSARREPPRTDSRPRLPFGNGVGRGSLLDGRDRSSG